MNLIASSSSDLVAAIFGSMITIAALMTWNKVSSDNKRSEQNRIVFEADKIKEELEGLSQYPSALASEKQKVRDLAEKHPKHMKPVLEELLRRGVNLED